jgi:hypothetical protein
MSAIDALGHVAHEVVPRRGLAGYVPTIAVEDLTHLTLPIRPSTSAVAPHGKIAANAEMAMAQQA